MLVSLLIIYSSQHVWSIAILAFMYMEKFAIFSVLLALTQNHRRTLAQLASRRVSRARTPHLA